tara:strand:+ start:12090 stop:12959 length:870 start_codon:yes stop_codon:yes gene_type:complete
MRFQSYSAFTIFDCVARHLNMTLAAKELNRSKGAISYQIAKLETELGFQLFIRDHSRLELTEAGRSLWPVSQTALGLIDREIFDLREAPDSTVTIGTLTYFASRWLSPRLNQFVETNPSIKVRVEPISSAKMLKLTKVDFAILWSTDGLHEQRSEPLLSSRVAPAANVKIATYVKQIGLEEAVRTIPLLGDGSGDKGWRAWHTAAGLAYNPTRSSLIIPDSNNRVQAIIDGQGLALWDNLIDHEISVGTLVRLSDIWIEKSAYSMVFPHETLTPSTNIFIEWLRKEKCI